MHICCVCEKLPLLFDDDRCHWCWTYHHIDCVCPDRIDEVVRLPILLRTSGAASTEVITTGNTPSTDVVTTGNTPSTDVDTTGSGWTQRQKDYARGAFAGLFLLSWIAYSTCSDRKSSGPGHWKSSAFKELETLSKMLLPSDQGKMPSTLSLIPSPWDIFKKGFQFGINPTPMPIPRVFASWSDMRWTVRLGAFAMFGDADDFASLRRIIDRSNIAPQWSTNLIRSGAERVVAFRKKATLSGTSGYLLGSQTYSQLTSKIYPLNHTVMWLQVPWDAAMMFNQTALAVGRNARLLKQLSPQHYVRVEQVIMKTIRPVVQRTLVGGLVTLTVGSGVVVPHFMNKFFSNDKSQ